ncbi:MAG: Auxin Efflux Carrier [Haloplasmataceae bacterium]|jgi:predicted permease|nr:Auxin Efflux Carrier [Haloplasmataceae bacterium]
MQHFIFIFTNVILPIFIIISCGYLMQKKFSLNTSTMAKIQFYVFIPALLFTQIYKNDLDSSLFLKIMLVVILIFVTLLIISFIVTRIFKFPKKTSTSFINSIVLFNSGNFCLPLITLLFFKGDENEPIYLLALSVQVIILLTQNVLTNTFGVFSANLGNKSVKNSLIDVFKLPMLYSVIIALIFRSFQIPVYTPILSALNYMANGLIPLALFTLGAQLANTKISFKIPIVYLSNFLRLIFSPLVAFLLVRLLNLDPVPAQVIVICSGAPTAVNSVLIAIEYDNEPELSSQIVFMSTLLSAITITIVIYLATNFF